MVTFTSSNYLPYLMSHYVISFLLLFTVSACVTKVFLKVKEQMLVIKLSLLRHLVLTVKSTFLAECPRYMPANSSIRLRGLVFVAITYCLKDSIIHPANSSGCTPSASRAAASQVKIGHSSEVYHLLP